MKTIIGDSFFNVFRSKEAPPREEEKHEDHDDDEKMKHFGHLFEALEIAENLYDIYTADGLEWYLGFGKNVGDLVELEPEEDDIYKDSFYAPKKHRHRH